MPDLLVNIDVDDLEKAIVSGFIGGLPGIEGGGAAKQARSVASRNLLQPRGRGSGKPVEPRGQRRLEPLLDFRALEQLVDDERAERRPNRLVLQQGVAGLHPVVGIERLSLGPDRYAEGDP